MTDQFEAPSRPIAVSICGVGGQGVVLAGVILGEAAVAVGLWACQSAAYTVAARGGFARSEVILAPEAQACPLAEQLDLVIGLAEEGWRVERSRLSPEGLALLDADVAPAGYAGRVVSLPLTELARQAGRPRSANLVALGALIGLTGILPPPAVANAIERAMGGRAGDLAAFASGVEAGRSQA